jgi:NADPH:quinone reductase-like Zn-dependent oxidoreductase
MKAITIASFGGADAIELTDQPDPIVGPDSILVRVRASSVNPVDWKIRQGYLQGAFPHHLPAILGWDLAGVVEAVGPAITEYAVGDEVFGYARKDSVEHGTYAEKVAVGLRHIARKPSSVSFDEAAAIPLAGLTALQLLDAVDLAQGETVLVHAAAGGVGSFAVQLAVVRGARVIGTAGEANHEFLRSLGAEPVTYGQGLAGRVRALAPDGVHAALDLIGGDAVDVSAQVVQDATRIASVVDAESVLRLGGHYVFVRPDPAGLARLAALVDEGEVVVQVAERFPLERAGDAQRLVEQGHVRGKVVITIA